MQDGALGNWGYANDSQDYIPMLVVDLYEKDYLTSGSSQDFCELYYGIDAVETHDADAYHAFTTSYTAEGYYGNCDLAADQGGAELIYELGIDGGGLRFEHPSEELVAFMREYAAPYSANTAASPWAIGADASFGSFDTTLEGGLGSVALYAWLYQADDGNHSDFGQFYDRDEVAKGAEGVFYIMSPNFRLPDAGAPPPLAADAKKRDAMFGLRAGVVEPWSDGLDVGREPILTVSLIESGPWYASGLQDMACTWVWGLSASSKFSGSFEAQVTFAEGQTWGNCEGVDTSPLGGDPYDGLVEGGAMVLEPLNKDTIGWFEDNASSWYQSYEPYLFAADLATGPLDDAFSYSEGVQSWVGLAYQADEDLNTDWSGCLSWKEAVAASDGVYYLWSTYNLSAD